MIQETIESAGFELSEPGRWKFPTIAGGAVMLEPTTMAGTYELAVYDRELNLMLRQKIKVHVWAKAN